MDIQISSNFERLLFELCGRDGDAVVEAMSRFRAEGRFAVDDARIGLLREHWSGVRVDDEQTVATIAEVYERTGRLVDPHTAVGIAAARAARPNHGLPVIALATAHPAKFPDAVEAATGIRPPLPTRLADLLTRPERYETLPNDVEAVRSHIERTLG
jgi:threonine synthase